MLARLENVQAQITLGLVYGSRVLSASGSEVVKILGSHTADSFLARALVIQPTLIFGTTLASALYTGHRRGKGQTTALMSDLDAPTVPVPSRRNIHLFVPLTV